MVGPVLQNTTTQVGISLDAHTLYFFQDGKIWFCRYILFFTNIQWLYGYYFKILLVTKLRNSTKTNFHKGLSSDQLLIHHFSSYNRIAQFDAIPKIKGQAGQYGPQNLHLLIKAYFKVNLENGQVSDYTVLWARGSQLRAPTISGRLILIADFH